MSASCPCPTCGQNLQDEKFYVRWYDFKERRMYHELFDADKFTVQYGSLSICIGGSHIRNGVIIGMNTGIVFRNNSEKPLPDYITDPAKRAITASNGYLPPIYKKDQKPYSK